jgi:recombinational DNA repair protein (RecF pathway)
MNLEGILIRKTNYRDRDIIGKLLLRSGKVIDVYFYGGRGGGKLQKGSILEIGYMLKVTFAPKRKKGITAMDIAKEWSLIWESKNIRKNFHAFYLLNLIFELTAKIAISFDEDSDEHLDDQVGLFKIISNSIFQLDRTSIDLKVNIFDHLFAMLGKLSLELGILPDLKTCLYCHESLDDFEYLKFEPQNGGFSCSECLMSKEDSSLGKNVFEEMKDTKKLRSAFLFVLQMKFSEIESLQGISRGNCDALFNYFCYQFNLNKSDFKSWVMVVAL